MDSNRAYAGDVVLMLVLLALAGPWGAGVAAMITLCRHSPIVVGAALEAMDRLGGDAAPALLPSPRVAALLPGAVPVLERPRPPRPPRPGPAIAPGMVIRPASIAAAAPQQDPAAAPERPRPAQQAAAPVLERPRWLQTINDEPDRTPHTIIIGPTRSGKTTMACAVLGERPGRTVVISPKVSAGNWRGAEVVTLDDDGTYAPIRQALRELEQEKRDRIVKLRRHGADALEPLTVVLDETPELVRFVPEAGDFVGSLSSIGAELKMRLMVLSTSSRVKDLGIEGRGAALDNFVRVDIDRDRRAVLSDGIREMHVPTAGMLSGAQRAALRPWRGEAPGPGPAPAPDPAPPDDLLAQLMAAEVPPIARQSVTIQDDRRQIVVNVSQQQEAPPSRPRARRRDGAINVQDRRRRIARAAYYQQAARAGVPFSRAYQDAPAGDKGNRNEMHAIYMAEKSRISAS
jgi:hypothetical protein